MAKKLELTFSNRADAEIVRYLQLYRDTRPVIIFALEYYIKTGEYLNIGTVCVKEVINADETKVRHPIYVPQNSIVEEWSDRLKKQRKGLLSVKVRQILKNSLNVTEDPAAETVREYLDCLSDMDRVYDMGVGNISPAVSVEPKATETISKPGFAVSQQPSEPPKATRKPNTNLISKLMPSEDWD